MRYGLAKDFIVPDPEMEDFPFGVSATNVKDKEWEVVKVAEDEDEWVKA